jgi:hypothetical protein
MLARMTRAPARRSFVQAVRLTSTNSASESGRRGRRPQPISTCNPSTFAGGQTPGIASNDAARQQRS